jgi:hypothetical protein
VRSPESQLASCCADADFTDAVCLAVLDTAGHVVVASRCGEVPGEPHGCRGDQIREGDWPVSCVWPEASVGVCGSASFPSCADDAKRAERVSHQKGATAAG